MSNESVISPNDSELDRWELMPSVLTDDIESELEADIEESICAALERHGIGYRRQVRCDAGIADIVTDHTVIEVKIRLTRSKLFEAVGQAVLYQDALRRKRAVVIARDIAEHSNALSYMTSGVNVDVYPWPHDVEGQRRVIQLAVPIEYRARLRALLDLYRQGEEALRCYEDATGDTETAAKLKTCLQSMQLQLYRCIDDVHVRKGWGALGWDI